LRNGSRTVAEPYQEVQDVQDVVVSTTPAPPSQAEEKQQLQEVWTYYSNAFGKDEDFTSARKKQGVAILRRHLELGHDPVQEMTNVIDLAKQLSKKKSKRFFTEWHNIFGKLSAYESLWTQYNETENVPPAVEVAVAPPVKSEKELQTNAVWTAMLRVKKSPGVFTKSSAEDPKAYVTELQWEWRVRNRILDYLQSGEGTIAQLEAKSDDELIGLVQEVLNPEPTSEPEEEVSPEEDALF
jgi:hypothetical protein